MVYKIKYNFCDHNVHVPVCFSLRLKLLVGLDHTFNEIKGVRLGSIWNKNNYWNNASKRLFGSYSHSGIPGFHSGYSTPRSRIAGIYSGIHSYSRIFPNECTLSVIA